MTVVNFTNILRADFALISFRQKIQTQTVITEKLHKIFAYKKAVRKMLVKLTPDVSVAEQVDLVPNQIESENKSWNFLNTHTPYLIPHFQSSFVKVGLNEDRLARPVF